MTDMKISIRLRRKSCADFTTYVVNDSYDDDDDDDSDNDDDDDDGDGDDDDDDIS